MQRISINDRNALATTLFAIQKGGVVIVPTDTVYGIGCDSARKDSTELLFKIKKRDPEKAVAFLFSDIGMVQKYTQFSAEMLEALERLWPGALTAILPGHGEHASTIGARIPNDTFVLELIRCLGRPLAMTSANISGRTAHTRIRDVDFDFKGSEDVDLLVDAGDLPESQASTVIDFTVKPAHIIREGPIERAHLENLISLWTEK